MTATDNEAIWSVVNGKCVRSPVAVTQSLRRLSFYATGVAKQTLLISPEQRSLIPLKRDRVHNVANLVFTILLFIRTHARHIDQIPLRGAYKAFRKERITIVNVA